MSQVGRRYDVNASLIFGWCRALHYRPGAGADDAPSFLPVEVVAEPLLAPVLSSDGRIEIALSNGHRVSAVGSFDVEALCHVVRAILLKPSSSDA